MKRISEIMKMESRDDIVTILTSNKKSFSVSYEEIRRQYDPYEHKVMDKRVRKDKRVKTATDKVDPMTGERIYKEKLVPRVRIAIPVQKVLVERSVGFLFGIPVEYAMLNESNEQKTELLEAVKSIFHKNKIKYHDKRLARALFSERECAELWYFELDEKGQPKKMRVKLLSPSRGDELYPHFDEYDRMDGFLRRYSVTNDDGRSEVRVDIYTDTLVYRYRYGQGKLEEVQGPKQHGFAKVPVIYFRQDETDWHNVQSEIDRVEELLSNWGDTDDYFGSPSYFFKGKLKGFSEKGEQGRVYEGDTNTDMRVLSWDSSPASMQGELANLFNIIFSYSQTPDISFENMKTLGGNTSGVAIKLMFTDPHMKADVKIELLGEMLTRRYNLVQNGYATSLRPVQQSVIDSMDVEPVFTPYMPKNELEEIQIINASTGGKATMSQEEGVKQNPRVTNPHDVLEQIRTETQQDLMNIAFGGAQ